MNLLNLPKYRPDDPALRLIRNAQFCSAVRKADRTIRSTRPGVGG